MLYYTPYRVWDTDVKRYINRTFQVHNEVLGLMKPYVAFVIIALALMIIISFAFVIIWLLHF